jgi:hypothetical protein
VKTLARSLSIIFASLTLFACVTGGQLAKKSALELQAIQLKEFETTKQIGFAATLSMFQDLGYVIGSADLNTGLITAKGPTLNEFVPFIGQKMSGLRATAFVEEIRKGRTKIRLNFVNSTETSSGYGMKRQYDEPIEEPAKYQDAFVKIQQGIFVRTNTN